MYTTISYIPNTTIFIIVIIIVIFIMFYMFLCAHSGKKILSDTTVLLINHMVCVCSAAMAVFKTDSRGFHTLTNRQSIPGVSQQKARYI